MDRKTHDPEYRKFVDESVVARELEDTIGRLRLSLFLAMLGPIILGMARVLQQKSLPETLILALYATGPAALVLFVVTWLRAPAHARAHRKTLTHLLLTVAASAGTFVLVQILFKAPVV
ncbi:MAG TPA: hypothetical protein VEJ18_18300 [Planctomycetota bacterium]|nr:hypothetical protein [Planctomycetota bacterium]